MEATSGIYRNEIFLPQIAEIKEKVSLNRFLSLGVNLGDKRQQGMFFSFFLNHEKINSKGRDKGLLKR